MQLSLDTAFGKRDIAETNMLLWVQREIANTKFLRTNTRFAQIDYNEEIQDLLYYIMSDFASIAKRKARYIPEFRDKDFHDMIPEKMYLNVTVAFLPEELKKMYTSSSLRCSTQFKGFSNVLKDAYSKEKVIAILLNQSKILQLTAHYKDVV